MLAILFLILLATGLVSVFFFLVRLRHDMRRQWTRFSDAIYFWHMGD